MRYPTIVATLLTAALAGSACQSSPLVLSDAQAAAVRDSVATVLREFREHSAAADWEAVGALYSESPGFRFFESGELRYGSAAAVRAALASLPADMRITTEYSDTQIQPLAAGVAVATTMFRSTFSGGTGPQFSFGGALTMLWVHEVGGWRIASGHSSVPVPRGG